MYDGTYPQLSESNYAGETADVFTLFPNNPLNIAVVPPSPRTVPLMNRDGSDSSRSLKTSA